MPEAITHPGDIELVHYVRGTLDGGHAAALLAHCLLCAACGQRLDMRLRAEHRPTSRESGSAPVE
jgi:anti-sigma factor ChrR (cupin superfamily)